MKQTQFGKAGHAQVKEWDIETGKFRLVAELEATDFKPIARSAANPQFLPLHLSTDGKTLVVAVPEVTGPDPLLKSGVLLLKRTSLQSIDVASGKVTTIAQTIGDSSLDWFDDTADVPEANTPILPTSVTAPNNPSSEIYLRENKCNRSIGSIRGDEGAYRTRAGKAATMALPSKPTGGRNEISKPAIESTSYGRLSPCKRGV